MDKSSFLNYKIIKCRISDQAPWLVLINGLFADLNSWKAAHLDFTENFNLLVFDGRNQGVSPTYAPDLKLSLQVNDLRELLDHLAIEECYFMGLSNGGRVALEFASLFPTKTLGVVACDTYHRLSQLLKLKLSSWLEAQEVGGPTHRFNISCPWIFGESVCEENPELIEYYRERASDIDPVRVTSLVLGALSGEVIELSKVLCPTLLVVGDEDLLTPKKNHIQMGNELVNGRVIVVKGGHASILEYPQAFKTSIKPFLTALL